MIRGQVSLSVVIPTLNGSDTIEHTLASISSNNFPQENFEVIVVDNGSTDQTVDIVRKFPAEICSCHIRGQGPARNVGISKARGEIVCFTDDDIIVPSDWLKRISDFFIAHSDVDGVGGPVLSPQFHVNNLQKLEGEIYVRGHCFPTEVTQSKYRDKKTALFSANSAYRKEALISVNGFEDSVFDAVDIDLCWRLIKKGKKLVFNPNIKVIHLGFPWNLRGVFDQQFRWGKSDVELKRRHPHESGNKEKIIPYYFFFTSFLTIFVSKHRKRALLKFLETCAFNCGRIYAFTHPAR